MQLFFEFKSGAVVLTNVPTHSPPLDFRFGSIGDAISQRPSSEGSDHGASDSDHVATGGARPVASSAAGSTDLFAGTDFSIDSVVPVNPLSAPAFTGRPTTESEVLAALDENRMQVFRRRLNLPALGVAMKKEVKPDMVDLSQITQRIALELPISTELAQTAVNAALNRVTQKEMHKELTEGQSYHQMIQVVTNRAALAREARASLQDLPHAEEEDYRIIVLTLSDRLKPAIEMALSEPSTVAAPALTIEQLSRDAAHWVIRELAVDLYESMFQAIAAQAKLIDAQPLPDLMIFPRDLALPASHKNIYGIMPPTSAQSQEVESVLFMEERQWWVDQSFALDDGRTLRVGRFDGWLKLNNPEARFAEAVDTAEFVVWWHRNPDRKPYSVAVVRADHDHYFYPDFVVCIEHEQGVPPMQRLIETKHDLNDARRKAAHYPPAYGKVLFITEDNGRMVRITDTGNLADVITFSETGSFLQLLRETRPHLD